MSSCEFKCVSETGICCPFLTCSNESLPQVETFDVPIAIVKGSIFNYVGGVIGMVSDIKINRVPGY